MIFNSNRNKSYLFKEKRKKGILHHVWLAHSAQHTFVLHFIILCIIFIFVLHLKEFIITQQKSFCLGELDNHKYSSFLMLCPPYHRLHQGIQIQSCYSGFKALDWKLKIETYGIALNMDGRKGRNGEEKERSFYYEPFMPEICDHYLKMLLLWCFKCI